MAEGYQSEGRGDHVEISQKGWEGRQLGTETASHVRGKDSIPIFSFNFTYQSNEDFQLAIAADSWKCLSLSLVGEGNVRLNFFVGHGARYSSERHSEHSSALFRRHDTNTLGADLQLQVSGVKIEIKSNFNFSSA